MNYVFIFFFIAAFIASVVQYLITRDAGIFSAMVNGTFENAKTGFEISLYLTGVMSLWLGLMRVGEKAGLIESFARLVSPFFRKLFPEIPAGHPVMGSMLMNISANMLGLDNAATPLGLKAMNELQELNPVKEHASNSQIMFLVLNASGLTIIPVSILVYRAQQGAANPADVFVPILIATFFSTLAGLTAVSIYQRINLFQPAILLTLSFFATLIAGISWAFSGMASEAISATSSLVGNGILLVVITGFILAGFLKKVDVYETFIDGAKDGFKVAIGIIPYLVGILVAIGLFRSSGCMDFVLDGLRMVVELVGLDTRFVDAMPTALMKPLSGSGARGMMLDTMDTFGADSFAGRLACVFQGSTETTFYVLSVYFGSVGVRYSRHALSCGLLADLAGMIAAISVAYLFFG